MLNGRVKYGMWSRCSVTLGNIRLSFRHCRMTAVNTLYHNLPSSTVWKLRIENAFSLLHTPHSTQLYNNKLYRNMAQDQLCCSLWVNSWWATLIMPGLKSTCASYVSVVWNSYCTGNSVDFLFIVETTLIFSHQNKMIIPRNKVVTAILLNGGPWNVSVNSRLTFMIPSQMHRLQRWLKFGHSNITKLFYNPYICSMIHMQYSGTILVK